MFQYKEDEDENGLNLDELSDDEEDEISLSSNLSADAADNVKVSFTQLFVNIPEQQPVSRRS